MSMRDANLLRRARPGVSRRGQTENGDAVQKAFESAVIREACMAVLRLDAQSIELDLDMLSCVSQTIGVARSSLGGWASAKGDNWITSRGIRAFDRFFRKVGKTELADEFRSKVLSDPVSVRLDARQERGGHEES